MNPSQHESKENAATDATPQELVGAPFLAPLVVEENETILGATQGDPLLNGAQIVEEAEEILREGAPHDFDVLVIGGGPGGYVAAIRAAQLGAHVALVEARELGGVCLHRGCIPTKTLLESVDVMRLLKRAGDYGIATGGDFKLDFVRLNARKREVIAQMESYIARLLKENGVEVLQGHARFVEEHKVEISRAGTEEKRVVSAVNIIVAVGSLPARLPVPGHDLPGVITSDELLAGEVEARDIVVVGAGAVGVEFAYLFQQMGAKTVLLERANRVMPQEDEEIGAEMTRLLREFGLEVVTEATLEKIEESPNGLEVFYTRNGVTHQSSTRNVLMAAGRRANSDELGLDSIGLKNEKGKIVVDAHCQTNVSGVYAIGDCTREAGWVHLASAEGTMVAELVTKNAVTIDLRHVPSCYYTHPEVARVGRTREQAEKEGFKVRVGNFSFRQNGRAASAGEHDGFVKIVVDDANDKLLGCQIIGPRATDLISEAVLALKIGQTVDEMVGAIHAHPTFSEALPEAALAARKKS